MIALAQIHRKVRRSARGTRNQPDQGLKTWMLALRKSFSLRVQSVRECTCAVAAIKRSGWLNVTAFSLPRATIRRHSRITSSSTGRIRPANQGLSR